MAINQLKTVSKQQFLERTPDSRIKRFVSVNRTFRVERVKSLYGLYRREDEVKANTLMAGTFGFVSLALLSLLLFLYNHFQL